MFWNNNDIVRPKYFEYLFEYLNLLMKLNFASTHTTRNFENSEVYVKILK